MFEAMLSDMELWRMIILPVLLVVLGVIVASMQDDPGGIW